MTDHLNWRKWAVIISTICLVGHVTLRSRQNTEQSRLALSTVRSLVSPILSEKLNRGDDLPKYLSASLELDNASSVAVEYTIRPAMQKLMANLFHRFKPDEGAFIAMDSRTGEVLCAISFHGVRSTGSISQGTNLLFEALFPAASVIKILTAALVLSEHKLDPQSRIAFSGQSHTLYQKNVMYRGPDEGHTQMTLKEAFAKSVNPVFGKVGVFLIDPFHMEKMANQFGFNQKVETDFEFETGKFSIREKSLWNLAEFASGFTHETSMSPVEGAMIASAVINHGTLMTPYFVKQVSVSTRGRDIVAYEAHPSVYSKILDEETDQQLKELMAETVKRGTSRKWFSSLLRKKNYAHLSVGGKTGSLSSREAKGKCDWFVGYAAVPGGESIGVAAMTISRQRWKVKPSYIARYFIENFFKKYGERRLAFQ